MGKVGGDEAGQLNWEVKEEVESEEETDGGSELEGTETEDEEERAKAKSCFVCAGDAALSALPPKSMGEVTPDDLIDLLQVPRLNLSQLKVLSPLGMLCLCGGCRRVIREGARVREEIRRLEEKLKTCREEILEKLKRSKGHWRSTNAISSEQLIVLESILESAITITVATSKPDLRNLVAALPPSPSVSLPAPAPLDQCLVFEGDGEDDDPIDIKEEIISDEDEAHPPPETRRKIGRPPKRPLPTPVVGVPSEKPNPRVKRRRGRKVELGGEIETENGRMIHIGKATFDCPTCPDVKDYGVKRFAQHLAIHQRLPYKCSVCSSFLPDDARLRDRHWADKHPTLGAEPAPKNFLKMSLDPGLIWSCEGCSTRFPSEDERDDHELGCVAVMFTTPKWKYPLTCLTCKKRCRNLDEWRLHRVQFHPEVDSKSCLYCDENFAETTVEGVECRNDEKMLAHIRQAHPAEVTAGGLLTQIFDECEPCGLVFKGKKATTDHFQGKHGIPLGGLICTRPICQLGFAGANLLRNHMTLTHFHKTESICEICGGSFQGLAQFLDHKLREHNLPPPDDQSESSLPVLSCSEAGCGFKTVLRRKLTSHTRRVHDPTSKFTCQHCGKSFKDSSHFSVHLHIHENKESKPYQCEICGNSFAVRNYIYIHKRLSHEGRTFPSTNKPKGPRNKKRKGDSEKAKEPQPHHPPTPT